MNKILRMQVPVIIDYVFVIIPMQCNVCQYAEMKQQYGNFCSFREISLCILMNLQSTYDLFSFLSTNVPTFTYTIRASVEHQRCGYPRDNCVHTAAPGDGFHQN